MKIKSIMTRFVMSCTIALAVSGMLGSNVLAAADTTTLKLDQTGSITVTMQDTASKVVTSGALSIYQVAETELVNGDMVYRKTDDFAESAVSIEDVRAAELASQLSDWLDAHDGISGVTQSVNGEGKAVFGNLPVGVYLVRQTTASDGYRVMSPFVVTVPLAVDDAWVYDVDASPKMIRLEAEPVEPPTPSPEPVPTPNPDPSPEPGTDTTPSADPTPTVQRPTQVLEDPGLVLGESRTTPTEPEEGAVLDATREPAEADEGVVLGAARLPQTGQLNWPIPFLAVGGVVLLVAGHLLRTTKDEKEKRHAA